MESKGKIPKFECLENEKSFLDEIYKAFFIVFKGLSLAEKIKNSGQALRNFFSIICLKKVAAFTLKTLILEPKRQKDCC